MNKFPGTALATFALGDYRKRLLNPLNPPVLGDLKKWGTPPSPRQKSRLESGWTSFSALCLGLTREGGKQ